MWPWVQYGGPVRSYEGVDPHYYRRNLREGKKKTRRVVYDEGYGPIVAGARVEHPKFGEGKVLSTDGSGAKATAVAFFGKEIGQKKLMLKYARMQRVE